MPELSEHHLSLMDAYRPARRLAVHSRETAAFTLACTPTRPAPGGRSHRRPTAAAAAAFRRGDKRGRSPILPASATTRARTRPNSPTIPTQQRPTTATSNPTTRYTAARHDEPGKRNRLRRASSACLGTCEAVRARPPAGNSSRIRGRLPAHAEQEPGHPGAPYQQVVRGHGQYE
jgi:hypothetical protein